MPRPAFTEDQLQAARTRILHEARGIVATESYDALSMRRLAEALGLTPGALYRYFDSKDAVMLALWADKLAALDARLAKLANSRGSHIKAIKTCLAAYAAFAFEDDVRFRTLLMQHQGKSGRDWSTDDVSQPGYRHIATRVSSAINDGTFRRIPVDLACQILWSAVHGVVTVTLTAEGFAYAERADLARGGHRQRHPRTHGQRHGPATALTALYYYWVKNDGGEHAIALPFRRG